MFSAFFFLKHYRHKLHVFPFFKALQAQIACFSFIRAIMILNDKKQGIVGKGSNTQICWKTKEFVGPEGFF